MADLLTMLGAYRVITRPKEAVAALDTLREDVKLPGLYRAVYPQQWAESRASFSRNPEALFSPREIEFLRLLGDEIPLVVMWEDDEGWDYEWEAPENSRTVRLCHIPYANMRPDLDDVVYGLHTKEDHSAIGWFGLLGLAEPHLRTSAEMPLVVRQELAKAGAGRVYLMVLERLCERRRTPLRHLPLTLQAFDASTGCFWWDTWGHDDYGAPHLEWSVNNVEMLRREYKRYFEIEQRIEELAAWLSFNQDHWREVVRLWNACLQPLSAAS